MRHLATAVLLLISVVALAQQDARITQQRRVLFKEVAANAVSQSQITLPGSKPFHIKIKIVESTNPKSDYTAEIEQFWAAPDKWRRTIKSPNFSQTLVVNGTQTYERDEGDYFPYWLQNLLAAAFTPMPMIDGFKQVELSVVLPTTLNDTSCMRFNTNIGAHSTAFMVFCFRGPQALLDSVVTPYFSAEYRDYKSFGKKQVARRIKSNPEPGTTLQADITELTELSTIDEKLFEITEPTPPEGQIRSVLITEAELARHVIPPQEITWPPIRSGKTSGDLSIFISVDRTGRVRETWPVNSDNASLNDAVRKQVESWRFKPAGVAGVPVQFQAILTFAFK